MNSPRSIIGQAAAAALPLMLAAGAGFLLYGHITGHAATPHHAITRHTATQAPQGEYLYRAAMASGWVNGAAFASYSALASFASQTGQRLPVAEVYTGLRQPFPSAEARRIAAAGTLPLIQVNPYGISLGRLAGGGYTTLLRNYAAAIQRTGVPIGLSFAHEASGIWYPWGCHHTPARAYIAAWRRFHDIIGTHLITWVWTADHIWHHAACPVMTRWPGRAYVNWVGIDGYLRSRGQTFAQVFGRTVTVLGHLGKPIILTEAGVPRASWQPGDITALYQGARADHCLGLIYFDAATPKGDYRPQDSPAALAAFRQALAARPAPAARDRGIASPRAAHQSHRGSSTKDMETSTISAASDPLAVDSARSNQYAVPAVSDRMSVNANAELSPSAPHFSPGSPPAPNLAPVTPFPLLGAVLVPYLAPTVKPTGEDSVCPYPVTVTWTIPDAAGV